MKVIPKAELYFRTKKPALKSLVQIYGILIYIYTKIYQIQRILWLWLTL